MRPTLLSIPDVPLLGDLDFHAYAVFLALAFLIGVLLPIRLNYTLPNPEPVTPLGGIPTFIGAMIFAKLYYIVQYGDITNVTSVIYFWRGGLVFYGGLIGGIIGALIYLKVVKARILRCGDLGMPYVALAHGVARIGCFLNGCCWGTMSSMPWAVHYPQSRYLAFGQQVKEGLISPDAQWSLGVHPTQLYETLGLIIIFIYLRRKYRRPHYTGEVLLFYPLCYGALRMITEAFRGDSARHFLEFTVSQYVALAMFVGAGITYAVLRLTLWRGPRPQAPKDELPEEAQAIAVQEDIPLTEKG